MVSGLCIPIVGPTQAEAEAQLAQAQTVADLVEFRVDLFREVDVAKLMTQVALPVILTLRTRQQGGAFTGSYEELHARLHQLAQLGPAYVDVEEGVTIDLANQSIIRSYHNFEELPADVTPFLRQQGRLHKIACRCRSAVEAMRLAKLANSRVVAVGMGTEGIVARILSAIGGAPFTFAALSDELTTAPGQPTAALLRERYHYTTLSPRTRVLGVIGDPVSGSIGPAIHNAAFGLEKLDAVYLGLRVASGELEEFFSLLSDFPFVGLSVTMPHKQAVVHHLDEVDEVATAIGAVNTIRCHEGKLSGTNTDGGGALDALEAVAPVSGKQLVVVGAGGAARAIVWEALRRGAKVTVLNRTEQKAEELANLYKCTSGPLAAIEKISYDFLVQATSVGMGDETVTPIAARYLRPSAIIMEIITHPATTRLMREAASRGARVIAGREMWVNQAARQLAFWFPERFDRARGKQLADRALASTEEAHHG
jgi:3-dehydroquinate dehydratase / shikimate dehydrogenase